jgi:outer membrane lipopolysaccharide assembly protein LptE/RlpB
MSSPIPPLKGAGRGREHARIVLPAKPIRLMLNAQNRCRILLWLLLAVPAGCGYQLSGQAGTVPRHLQRIAVPLFTNATPVPGLEQLVTAAVRTQMQRDGRVHVSPEASATALLQGTVRNYQLLLLASDRNDFALEYRVEMEVHVIVEDLQRRQTVLNQTLAVNIDYVVSSQIVSTDIARERALQAVARDAGERVASLLLDRF